MTPRVTSSRSLLPLLAAAMVGIPLSADAQGPVTALGPRDGSGLNPLDTGRVAVGTVAPDFTLEAMDSGTVALSQFRGRRNVILVFYRGHW